jgi:hypothetical protein
MVKIVDLVAFVVPRPGFLDRGHNLNSLKDLADDQEQTDQKDGDTADHEDFPGQLENEPQNDPAQSNCQDEINNIYQFRVIESQHFLSQ